MFVHELPFTGLVRDKRHLSNSHMPFKLSLRSTILETPRRYVLCPFSASPKAVHAGRAVRFIRSPQGHSWPNNLKEASILSPHLRKLWMPNPIRATWSPFASSTQMKRPPAISKSFPVHFPNTSKRDPPNYNFRTLHEGRDQHALFTHHE